MLIHGSSVCLPIESYLVLIPGILDLGRKIPKTESLPSYFICLSGGNLAGLEGWSSVFSLQYYHCRLQDLLVNLLKPGLFIHLLKTSR